MTRAGDMPVLLEIVLRHTSKRFPTKFAQLFQAVLDDYGTTYERRVYRALAWLIQQGAIRPEGKISHGIGRDYYRVLDKPPTVARRLWCSECNMVGVSSRSHIEGEHRLHRWFAKGRVRKRFSAYDVIVGSKTDVRRAPAYLRASANQPTSVATTDTTATIQPM